MKEKLNQFFMRVKTSWGSRSSKQKTTLITSIVAFIVILSVVLYFVTKPNMVPLYSELTPSETGSIKESLDSKGISSEIADGGTTIKVPKQNVDDLKVQLAAEGIPKSGSIDYSFFSQNTGFGMTDNEFNVLKLDAMQTELGNLITEIDGVKAAKVMITMPEKGIFVSDGEKPASASIVLNTKPGYEFDEKQIKSLYHLVSKSVPNLDPENIVIMNQNFEYYDLQNSDSGSGNAFLEQMNIKKQIERDIQRQVQSMLGTLMGYDKVVATVTADVDFTQENREENLVTPVDKAKMAGIAISAQKITETFTGNGASGGPPQAETPTDSQSTSYQAGQSGNGDYEKIQDTVNNEVNRIKKKIVESPYKIRDLGIQVLVEPPNPKDVNSLPQSRVNDIQKMLGTIVRTSIDKSSGTDLTDPSINNKIVVSVQPFKGKVSLATKTQSTIPMWVYIVGGVLLVVIALLIFFMLRARRKSTEEEEFFEETIEKINVPDVNLEKETEGTMKKKQLEKMAKEKPDEFAKLLRSWLADE
jgi:flagellar M-ring protein FliF